MKTAYQKLCDEKEKNVCVINIEHITDEVHKERKRLIQKGVRHCQMHLCLTYWLTEWLTDWMNEGMNEGMNEWVTK